MSPRGGQAFRAAPCFLTLTMGAGVCRVGWGPGGPSGLGWPELTLTLLTVGGLSTFGCGKQSGQLAAFFASWWPVDLDVVGIPAVGGLPDRWAASLGQVEVVRWGGNRNSVEIYIGVPGLTGQ
jgi:hypothetical protein